MAGDEKLGGLEPEGLRRVLRQQRHLEAATRHPQLLHRLRDRTRQLGRRLPACGRHLPGLRVEGGLRLRQLALQRVEVGGGLERAELAFPFGQQRGQLAGRPAIAPRQAHPGRHALVDLLQPLGLDLGVVQVARQGVRCVLQLRLRALQHLDDGRELRVVGRDFLQRIDRAAGQRFGALVGIVDGIERTARGVDQRLRIRQLLVLAIQFVPFVGTGRQLVDLADLPGQPLALARQVGLLRLRGVQRLRGRLPA